MSLLPGKLSLISPAGTGSRYWLAATGLYISSLLDNITFAETGSSAVIREHYKELAEREGNEAVWRRLMAVDPETAAGLHPNNIGRVIRALELYELTGIPISRHKELSRQQPSPYEAVCIALDYRSRQTSMTASTGGWTRWWRPA